MKILRFLRADPCKNIIDKHINNCSALLHLSEMRNKNKKERQKDRKKV